MNIKKSIKLACVLAIFLASCGGKPAENPAVENTPASSQEAQTQAAGGPAVAVAPGTPTVEPVDDNLFSFGAMGFSLRFDFPQGYSQSAISTIVAKSLEAAGPGEPIYPEHARILFAEKASDSVSTTAPGIRIFKASEVNEADPKAFESLNAVLNGQLDQRTDFPHFAGAGSLIDAQVTTLPFKSGNGYRYLLLKKFDASSLSDTSMTYLYQGLTTDGKYIVTMIAQVDAPFLADLATGQPFASNEEALTYKNLVNDRLNTASPDQFSPSLTLVDKVIASIIITNK
ncbi:MAG: hypothetical protein U0Z26_14510 [Anaerolineales bacterium]